MDEMHRPARAVTRGPKGHWFGYYDKFPWDATGRYLVCLEVDFQGTRSPRPDDAVAIGLIDTQRGNAWTPLAQTRAWCWQQSTMLHWLPTAPDSEILYNAVNERGDGFVAAVRNVFTGETRTLPRPVYALSPDGTKAVSIDFARTGRLRPGYGYVSAPDLTRGDPHPADSGVWMMDLATGDHELIVTIGQAAALSRDERMDGAEHWFNHLQFNTDGSRFLFLHRWTKPEKGWFTRLLTAKPDGSDLCIVNDDDMTSHFDWRDATHILAWARQHGRGDHYYLFTDRSAEAAVVGDGVLWTDGHCTYAPDRRWFLTDTYPDRERLRHLLLFRPADERLVEIGAFHEPPEFGGEWRCDLHGRWSRDGRQVCFDSVQSGQRQLYVIDVADLVAT